MDILEIGAAGLNLTGSILLGLDLLMGPRRLREDSGVQRLLQDLAAQSRDLNLFVLLGGKEVKLENFQAMRAFVIQRRGMFGIELLILGFALQLASAIVAHL